MQLPIYLDYAATTPVDPRVISCLVQHLSRDGIFGNPSSNTHTFGYKAACAIEVAREQVADLLSAKPVEIIWTSGATEANNLALCGALRANLQKGRHLITSKTEHRAVLDVCRWLEKDGYTVSYLDANPDGLIDLEKLAAALRPDTVLVSLMHVNNETGVVQDLAAISTLTQENGVLLHVDASQSVGKLPIDLQALPIDLLSLSAHKIYGPKGSGALFVRHCPKRQIHLKPLIHGGGQERGLRAGTLAVHQIVATGEACQIAGFEMKEERLRLKKLRNRLLLGLTKLGKITLNGHPTQNWSGILNISFAGITAEALITATPEIAVATGSACTSANIENSHVLRAMGCSATRARGAIRFSVGRFTTNEEVDYTIHVVSAAVRRLRAISPIWEQLCSATHHQVDWSAPL